MRETNLEKLTLYKNMFALFIFLKVMSLIVQETEADGTCIDFVQALSSREPTVTTLITVSLAAYKQTWWIIRCRGTRGEAGGYWQL